MADRSPVSETRPIANLDIRLRRLEGDEFLVYGSSIEHGETEPVPTRLPTELFDTLPKIPNLTSRDMAAYGRQLFEAIFRDPMASLLYRLQEDVDSDKLGGLRLRLTGDDAPYAYQLPWEFLHNGRSFLSLAYTTTILRYLPLPDPPPQPDSGPTSQTVLMVMAGSGQYTSYDPGSYLEQIMAATSELRSTNQLDIDTIILSANDNLSRVQELLAKRRPRLLHFTGHGRIADDGLPTLQLATTNLTADRFAALLSGTGVTTVVLDSPPHTGWQEALPLFAASLVQVGTPVVITLPQGLPTQMDVAFWRSYYTSMANGAAVDTAVATARRTLYTEAQDDIFFGIPQLYTRLPVMALNQPPTQYSQPQTLNALDEDPSFEKVPATETLTPAQNIAQQTAVEQRPLTKGGYDTLPGVIDAPATSTTSDYNAEFINHITIPDGARIEAGREFQKSWRVRNTSSFNWFSGDIDVAHRQGEPLSNILSYTVKNYANESSELLVEAGRSLEISVTLTAPDEPGDYQSSWQLQHDGLWFGDTLPIAITVISPPKQETAAAEPAYTGRLRILDTLLRANQFAEALSFAQSLDDPDQREEALALMVNAMSRTELSEADPTLDMVVAALSGTTADRASRPSDTTTIPASGPSPQPSTLAPSRERHIWLYHADGSSDAQLRLLNSDTDPLIWGANPHTRAGDLVLIYRTSPMQDFAALFTAATDPVPQDEATLPTGWNDQWQQAISLSGRRILSHPLPRQVAHSHPDLAGWNLMRTPQGSMRHESDLRGYADGNWPALWTLLLAWNPDQWPVLANWDDRPLETLRRDTYHSLRRLPASDERQAAWQRLLAALPAGHPLRQEALNDDDLAIWEAMLAVNGRSQPTPADIRDKAQSLHTRQQPDRLLSLLTQYHTAWQSATPDLLADIHTLQAKAHELLGQIPAAVESWQQAARQDPNRIIPFGKLVQLSPTSDLDTLDTLFTQLAAANPDAAGPRAGLAAIARERQEDEAERTHFAEAIERALTATARADIERLRPITISATAVPIIEPEADPILRRKQDRLRLFMLHHFHKNSDLEELIAPLDIKFDNLHGDILNHRIISLVNLAKRNGRLLELEMEIISTYRRSYNPNPADFLDRVYICLHLGQPATASAELEKWRAQWEEGDEATDISRARGYALTARFHELPENDNQPEAYKFWLKAAVLDPNDTAVYEGVVRTSAEDKLEDTHKALTLLEQQHPQAKGPRLGLLALAQRRARLASGEDVNKAAAEMASELRSVSGDAVREARAAKLAAEIEANPEQARHISLSQLTAVTPTSSPTDTEPGLTLQSLTALARQKHDNQLNASDQRRIIEQFLTQTLALPTLTASHRRELRQRGRYVLRELDQSGTLTPQLVADLHLPVLDALFIDQPAQRRALLLAAAAYRQHPGRRLVLLLRHRARRQLQKQLRGWVQDYFAGNLPDMDAVITAVSQPGTITYNQEPAITPDTLWQPERHHNRHIADWREARVTLTGNHALALPPTATRQMTALASDLWPAINDLLFRQDGIFQHMATTTRLDNTSLHPVLAQLLLYIVYPDDHPLYDAETAVTALNRLGLTTAAAQLTYTHYTDFCQRLLHDDDLGFHNLDDVTLFLTQLSSGAITFTPEALTTSQPTIWPRLAQNVTLHPRTIDTGLTLPTETFRQMSSALNAGNHIILIGPPGTGKTTIAQDVCRRAHDLGCSRGFLSVTATADWTTFDTVGGYMPNTDNQLEFNEGVFLRAIREEKWLVIDEINRADIDKAFGELFTVLSGQAVTLPYRDGYHPIRILPPGHPVQTPRDYVIPASWRIIGTMNVYDKASLFEMSYAFMRRFAFVDVAIPDEPTFASLIRRFWEGQGLSANHTLLADMQATLFKQDSIVMQSRPLGPAIARDIIGYLGQRQAHTGQIDREDLCEAFLLYAIPQFDGIEDSKIEQIFMTLSNLFAEMAAAVSLRRRLRDLFPQFAQAFPSETNLPTALAAWRQAHGLDNETEVVENPES